MGWESTGSTFTMKVVPVNSIKCNHILSIPSSLYIGQKLPGSGCTFKMQVVPGNFFPIYRELEIARNLCHFQNLAKSFQKMPNSDSWQFLAFLQWAGNCQEPLFFPFFLEILVILAIFHIEIASIYLQFESCSCQFPAQIQ